MEGAVADAAGGGALAQLGRLLPELVAARQNGRPVAGAGEPVAQLDVLDGRAGIQPGIEPAEGQERTHLAVARRDLDVNRRM